MAITNNITTGAALVATLATYKADNGKRIETLDTLYATQADKRAAQYAANGAQAARKAKGYGRDALATALNVPAVTVWHYEFYVAKGSPALATYLKHVDALPTMTKPTASKATPATSKGKATPATSKGKATPATSKGREAALALAHVHARAEDLV